MDAVRVIERVISTASDGAAIAHFIMQPVNLLTLLQTVGLCRREQKKIAARDKELSFRRREKNYEMMRWCRFPPFGQ